MTGPVNVKTISTLNVKSGRSGKCETKFYAKCEKSLVSCMTSQTVSLDNLVGLVRFFSVFSGFGVSTFQNLKILVSAMILREM